MKQSRINTELRESKEGKAAQANKKRADAPKGRMKQPKGSMSTQKPTMKAKKEKNSSDGKESMKEMMF